MTLKRCNDRVIQLAEGVHVRTSLPSAYIPALRSGFALYPVNPRWNAMKFGAWKTGRQWRQALSQGRMLIRSTDLMLVDVNGNTEADSAESTPASHKPQRSAIDRTWLLMRQQVSSRVMVSAGVFS